MKKLSFFNFHLSTPKGFTLFELLVAASVLLVFGAVLVTTFSSLLRNTNRANSLAIVRQNGSYVLNEMTRKIRFARSISGVTSCDPPITFSPATISVTTSSNQQVAFRCQNNTIEESVGGGAYSSLLSNSVTYSSCSFTCQQQGTAPPSLTIQFGLVKDATSVIETKASESFQTTVVLRNWGR